MDDVSDGSVSNEPGAHGYSRMTRLLKLVQALANCGANVPPHGDRQTAQQARHILLAEFRRNDHQFLFEGHLVWEGKAQLPLTLHERLGNFASLVVEQTPCRNRLGVKECLLGLAFLAQLAERIIRWLGCRVRPDSPGKANV
jgi:hypothetical protein